MSALMQEVAAKALALGVPLSVQLDLTWRCNLRCLHCYLEHDGSAELPADAFAEILDQLAEAGAFFLILSGGEVLLREDFFEILEHARARLFSVRLKTNGTLLGASEARRLRALAVQQVDISIYSHRREVHDGVTRTPGSLERSLEAIRELRSQGVSVRLVDVLMRQNVSDYQGVQALAAELGAAFATDPPVTPKMNGDRSVTALRIPGDMLQRIFRDPSVVGHVGEFCAPPPPPDEAVLNEYPCSAAHTACYISPCGDLYPCVQFLLPCGNLRRQRFAEIWRGSPALAQLRAIRSRDLPLCRQCANLTRCTRCPGLAYLEGDLLGPSTLDCEKAHARTSIPPSLAASH
jgi:radical SAM protein with 4Fe4S-binding SPASM domain